MVLLPLWIILTIIPSQCFLLSNTQFSIQSIRNINANKKIDSMHSMKMIYEAIVSPFDKSRGDVLDLVIELLVS